jgi:hypothetical protein
MDPLTREEAVAAIDRGFVEDPDEEPRMGVDGGWWHTHNGATFIELFEILVDKHKITPDDAYSILGSAFGATADEYGD